YIVSFNTNSLSNVYFIFFFFQAEDGIRDRNVTGVQTCALPIFDLAGADGIDRIVSEVVLTPAETMRSPRVSLGPTAATDSVSPRSEERRVGKESRTQR